MRLSVSLALLILVEPIQAALAVSPIEAPDHGETRREEEAMVARWLQHGSNSATPMKSPSTVPMPIYPQSAPSGVPVPLPPIVPVGQTPSNGNQAPVSPVVPSPAGRPPPSSPFVAPPGGTVPMPIDPQSAPSGAPVPLPGGPLASNPGNLTKSSLIPICKVNALGNFILVNDDRYNAPGTQVVTSETSTFESTDTAFATVNQASADIRDAVGTVSTVETVSKSFRVAFASFAAASGFLALGLNVLTSFGVGGTTVEDAILEAVAEGFRQVNTRLTEIEIQIRRGFQDLALLVGDVALDELAASLDSTLRAYNDYTNATSTTRSSYEATFRASCNKPERTPQDIFYNLYGYACKTCLLASRKRANLLKVAAAEVPFSAFSFRRKFANFILPSMFNAIYLHSVCLPPVPGSCVDRSNDIVWLNGIKRMEEAANETISVIEEASAQLSDWVKLLKDTDILLKIPEQGSDPGAANQNAANAIRDFLAENQPDFDIQVIAATRNQDFLRSNIFRSFQCFKNDDPQSLCTTIRTETSHFYFEIKEVAVDIRYRFKALPPPATTVTIGGVTQNFADFYNGLVNRIDREESLNLQRPDQDACPISISSDAAGYATALPKHLTQFEACLIDICFQCTPEEQAEFDRVIRRSDSYYIHREGKLFVGEANSNATSFPSFTAVVGETFLLDSDWNSVSFGKPRTEAFKWFF
jgi:hypothetical protein